METRISYVLTVNVMYLDCLGKNSLALKMRYIVLLEQIPSKFVINGHLITRFLEFIDKSISPTDQVCCEYAETGRKSVFSFCEAINQEATTLYP
jgi:hypothetical protein